MLEKMKKHKAYLYVRNTLIFLVIWNLVCILFRRPYVFDVLAHLIVPTIVALLATHWNKRQVEIMDVLVEDPSKKKKWDPYNHD